MQKINQPLELAKVKEHRKDDCINYACCLHEASALLWPSFSCKDCKRYCTGASRITSYERSASPLGWEF